MGNKLVPFDSKSIRMGWMHCLQPNPVWRGDGCTSEVGNAISGSRRLYPQWTWAMRMFNESAMVDHLHPTHDMTFP